MGRIPRRRSGHRAWVRRLPDPFTLRDLMAITGREGFAAGLTWLYAVIERGRVEPHQHDDGMHYGFAGPRRSEDCAGASRARA